MSKADQVLSLEPSSELIFRGPFTSVVTSELKLTNPSDRQVLFKVKTTAPKRYCVRPNGGVIEPKAYTIINVMLQPFEYDPSEKNKHKFMVQTMFSPERSADQMNIPLSQLQDTWWKEAQPEQLMDSKLRCIFDLPSANNKTSMHNNLNSSGMSGDDNVNMAPVKPLHADKLTSKVQNIGADVLTGAKSAQGGDYDAMRTELLRLRQENQKLKDEESTVRRRQVGSSAPSGGTVQSSSGTGRGVVSAKLITVKFIVCLIAFLILGILVGKFLL